SGEKQTWQEQFSFLADDVLGKQDEYEEFESDYEDKVAEVKENIEVPEGEVSILSLDDPKAPYIFIEGNSSSSVLEPLGFTNAPLFAENDIEPYSPGGDLFSPSLEVLPEVLRSETVFVVGFNNADIGVDDLENASPYDRVPAFESGQAYDLPYWSMRGDYDEAMALLDIIEDQFGRNCSTAGLVELVRRDCGDACRYCEPRGTVTGKKFAPSLRHLGDVVKRAAVLGAIKCSALSSSLTFRAAKSD